VSAGPAPAGRPWGDRLPGLRGAEPGKGQLLPVLRVAGIRTCHLLTVLGQAGVGKTRLVGEALRGLPSATVLRGRCLSYGEGITYWPVAEIVRQAAGISDTDPPAAATAKLRRLLGPQPTGRGEPGDQEGDADQVAARIGQLIGLEAAPGPAEEAVWAFRRLLEILADRGPVVVVFDDLHWAEPGLLDLVEHVADYARGAPILLVAMARPEFLEQRPGWAGGKLNATTMLLEPLDDAEAAELLAALAGPIALPEGAAKPITKAAEGNPLFLEELLAALVEEGRLRPADGRWVAADLADLGIPSSIQALLTARLDRLDDDERAVLERAAVAGQVFEQNAVVELSPAVDPPSGPGPATGPGPAGAAAPVAVPAGRRPGVPVPPPAAARRRLRLDPQADPGRSARAVRRLGRADRRAAPARDRGDRRLPRRPDRP